MDVHSQRQWRRLHFRNGAERLPDGICGTRPVNGSTIAVRPFSSPLAAGQSFSVQLRLNSLDRSYTTNTLVLRDASGNAIFRYWHVGFEPNGAVTGRTPTQPPNNGVAVGFSYNYQQFCTFTFTLNSATTYTFTDNTTGHSFKRR